MADASRRNSDDSARRQQQSRLQRRRPASLQISPESTWNVAIPLLSPLASSPKSIEQAMMEMKKSSSSSSSSRADSRQEQRVESEKLVFKKWQHPAAPFCYETPSIKPSFFVPV
ncbi:hypothetical protein Dsin_029858 [Dipteronia sinensis]|uniref:Uncharacterized protein n=1 Tax=Dipteronia sinensis TaxID=43782 RepID=A0AAD9ZUI5_9ROSI|nr:hypothetical protein Dsin_029847 [Dipteronia sinensis]KAK3190297.1 hypothetical protein Dsin_029858 [Dipteronia sinensis]